MNYKKALLGIALVVVPGAGIVYGTCLLYKTIKKKPKTAEEFIQSLRDEFKDDKTKS